MNISLNNLKNSIYSLKELCNIHKKNIAISFAIILSTSLIIFYPSIRNYLEKYAIDNLYESLGSLPVSKEIEEKINHIAKEMNFTQDVAIKKMNTYAMRIMGYHNAFACYPTLFFTFAFDKPHLYISEGFFEDLSLEEQRFLIGHELAHIQEHHLLYLNLILAVITILLLIFWWFVVIIYSRKFILNTGYFQFYYLFSYS